MTRKLAPRLLLTLALTLSLLGSGLQPALAADGPADNGRPYYITVNRTANTVTVYGLDADGYYTVPVKAMVCSVGRSGSITPRGTFSVGSKRAWLRMVDRSYGQYATQFYGNYLFHSVCYSAADPSTLLTQEYNLLGSPASLGCVRLQTIDAKWIYDNCAAGTKVKVYDDDDPGPLGKPDKAVAEITPEMDNGWDPTDPREDNPWHGAEKPLPFKDLAPGAWYYDDVRYVYEAGIMEGTGDTAFSPEAPVTYAMAEQDLSRLPREQAGQASGGAAEADRERTLTRQELAAMLYQYEVQRRGRSVYNSDLLSRFSDRAKVADDAREAVSWAVGTGLIQGTARNTLDPAASVSRAQEAAVLHRYLLYIQEAAD